MPAKPASKKKPSPLNAMRNSPVMALMSCRSVSYEMVAGGAVAANRLSHGHHESSSRTQAQSQILQQAQTLTERIAQYGGAGDAGMPSHAEAGESSQAIAA